MSPYGTVHVACSFLALAAGAVVFRLPKGTRWHRTLGHVYAMGMVGVVATSLVIYRLTGHFGPFHVAALVAALTLAGGLWTVLARRPRKAWIGAHATWMSWSYIGLAAALVAESMTRWIVPVVEPHLESGPLWGAFWGTALLASLAVMAVGAHLVRRRLPASVAGTPAAMRRERARLQALEEGAD